MSATNAPYNPEPPGGGFSTESAPQVIVRAGETFVCSACGALVEVPAEVVGQMIVPVQQIEPPAAEPSPPAREPGPTVRSGESPSPSAPAPKVRPPRPVRPRQPLHMDDQPERIDGLVVPTTKQIERLLAWIEYRLGRLSALQQIEKQLDRQKPQRVRGARPRRHAKQVPLRQRYGKRKFTKPTHAHDDVGMAPKTENLHQRGPP